MCVAHFLCVGVLVSEVDMSEGGVWSQVHIGSCDVCVCILWMIGAYGLYDLDGVCVGV